MSSNYAIELNNVSKKYKLRSHHNLREQISSFFSGNNDVKKNEFWALKNINIKIKKGECVGLYGPNGSGKTTILKLIASVTYPTYGKIIVNGRIAPLISLSAGFHPDLTGRENILTNGTILGMKIKEVRDKENDILEFSGLNKDFLETQTKKYSSGMIARLGFSVAVHSNADILLLDEVLAVGDENFKSKAIEKIKSYKGNKTIIIVSHNKNMIEEIANRIYLMDKKEFIEV